MLCGYLGRRQKHKQFLFVKCFRALASHVRLKTAFVAKVFDICQLKHTESQLFKQYLLLGQAVPFLTRMHDGIGSCPS